jgi:RNA polymerase sigma factor (sigma-70 family)
VRRKSGDRGAPVSDIGAAYEAGFAAFGRAAAAITGDAESGRDAVQDAFATALERRADFRGDGPLEGWLWRIVVNSARQTARRRPPPSPYAVNGTPEDPADAATRALLARLPERQRLVVFLRYYADLDQARIAGALGIRRGTVAATLHAAHATLRRHLEEVPS